MSSHEKGKTMALVMHDFSKQMRRLYIQFETMIRGLHQLYDSMDERRWLDWYFWTPPPLFSKFHQNFILQGEIEKKSRKI